MAHKIEQDIIRLVHEVEWNPAKLEALGEGERRRVALVLNRFDLLEDSTMLEALRRCLLSRAALRAQWARLPFDKREEAEARAREAPLPEKIEPQVIVLVDEVERNRARFGTLGTEQRLMVALVLNRFDLLQEFTMLEAFHRLGPLGSKWPWRRRRRGGLWTSGNLT